MSRRAPLIGVSTSITVGAHRGGVGARPDRRGHGARRPRALRARRAVASGRAGGPLGAGPASLRRPRGRGSQILTPPAEGPAAEGLAEAPPPDASAVFPDAPPIVPDSPAPAR